MTNYQNGKIYKIEDVGGNLCYIGSTTKQYLSQRMTWHRGDYKKWLAGKGNKITVMDIFEKYGVENCKIVLIELYPCNSKDELHKREAHFIKTLDCVNKCIPGRTRAEYEEVNKAKIKEEKRLWHENNKEKVKARVLQNKDKIKANNRIKINCDCGIIHQKGGRSHHIKSLHHINYIQMQINNV
jgi:hypothetical protein